MKKVVIFLIDLYRNTLSLMKMRSCRFYPTCSAYTKEAVNKYGAFKGIGLGIKRIFKCNHLNPGGFDPVP
ncbi:MAG: membrane protein insertion efficiency factor YidD [Candidatus Omnitrophica bacterium]|nr:membrane protein insertion efficiency factor YidD [Candidatus Omnitrophota bacterium]